MPRLLMRVLRVVAVLYLALFAMSEIYSALATALDHSTRFPAWEWKLGWCLLLLPLLLTIGGIFRVYHDEPKFGIYLVALSVILYLAFMVFEDFVTGDRLERGDLIDTTIWTAAGVLAIAASAILRPSGTEGD